MRLLTLLPIVFTLVSSIVRAQQCTDSNTPTLVNDTHSSSEGYGFTGIGYECFDSESYFHFVGARGAFANAMTAKGRHNVSPGEELQNVCKLTDPNGVGAVSCLKYTRDCSASGVGPACLTDALGQSGEISCSCQIVPPQSLQRVNATLGWPSIGLGLDHGFFTRLLTDKDVDGQADEEAADRFFNNMRVLPLRVRPLSRGLWRMEWEDLFPKETGDYNDYVSAYELHECRPGRWPLDTENVVPTCLDECGDENGSSSCIEGPGAALAANLRFRANISVEETFHIGESFVDFEANGPRFQLSLTAHGTFTKQALIDLMSVGQVAICPIVAFPVALKRARSRVSLHYGATCGNHPPNTLSGQAICEVALPSNPEETNYLHLGLGRSYLRSTLNATFDNSCDVAGRQTCTTNSPETCNSRMPSDIIPSDALTPPTACNGQGTTNLNLWFEAPIKDITAAASPGFSLSDPSNQRSTVSWVDVLVFHDIKAKDFVCPTGVDILFDGVDPAVAKVQRYRLFRSTTGFTDQLIYR